MKKYIRILSCIATLSIIINACDPVLTDETIMAHVNGIPSEILFGCENENKRISGFDYTFTFVSDANWCIVSDDRIYVGSNNSTQLRTASINVNWEYETMKVITVRQEGLVSLGVVINGITWATCNVDNPGTFAANPESAGKFYQWNRRAAWATTGSISGWNSSIPSGTSWTKANDPSPAGWRVPTFNEINSLLNTEKVTSIWITLNGVNGQKFTDKSTGNSIFLPASGCRYDNGSLLVYVGSEGGYWSSTQHDSYSNFAYLLAFYNYNYLGHGDYLDWTYSTGNLGFSVRSVAE